jgi:pimeloyl-ACP methyl ester carboxylesterase
VAKNVLLVHGAWADGSCWSRVIPSLQAARVSVTAVQLPLSSLAEDVATVGRAIDLLEGDVVLVGHSYGGAVITQAGTAGKVRGLVYIAAFAPDEGESAFSVGSLVAASPAGAEIRPDAAGFLKLTPKGVYEDFAQDLSDGEKAILVATQGPTSVHALGSPLSATAWKNRPSWFVLAAQDRTIPPELQRLMSKRMKAITIEIPSSHVAMLTFPAEVAKVILHAVDETLS